MAELSISEAAAALGVSVDTIRRKIKRGEMQAEQDEHGKYMVKVKAADGGPVAPPTVGGPAETARLRLELDQAERMIDELRHQREVLEAELQGARQAMQDAATERSELRRLLGNAQALQLSHALPPPAEGQAPQAIAAPRKRHWYWPFGR